MALTTAGTKPDIEYPSTDGEPMAQNTKQYRYITTIQGGLAAMFRNRDDVFVASDLFWYPIEGDNTTRAAPDVMVVFGRPKGDRDSYRQWEEGGVAPQVVFEILSPSNTLSELLDKSLFYEHHGVQEYYIYDPDGGELYGFVRDESGRLCGVHEMQGWVSPLLGFVSRWRAGSWFSRALMGSVLWGMRSWLRRWSRSATARRATGAETARTRRGTRVGIL
jgi:Uma2 family endonuclease